MKLYEIIFKPRTALKGGYNFETPYIIEVIHMIPVGLLKGTNVTSDLNKDCMTFTIFFVNRMNWCRQAWSELVSFGCKGEMLVASGGDLANCN